MGAMLWFRRNWIRTTGRVLDSRIRRIYRSRQSAARITLHSYVVEFVAPGGKTARLEVEQRLEVIDLPIGSEAPLLVKPDGTKAVFDHKDPQINVLAVNEARKRAEEERFRQQLGG
jgi:hypothetical protein